jgi:hypothetical protein
MITHTFLPLFFCVFANKKNFMSMEVQYHNLYTHFVFTTQDRFPAISTGQRERIEYITGTVNNHQCKRYAIYANPEQVHLHTLSENKGIRVRRRV